MGETYGKFTDSLKTPLAGRSRLVVLLAVVALVPTLLLPLWHMSFWAQQYPEGLDLYMYSHSLEGGDHGNDLTEINILNHYIGMAELRVEDFTEFKWIPLVIGLVGVLALRAAAIGTLGSVLDVLVVAGYFGAFSMWRFYHKLYLYGHQLDPRASVKVEPFTPPLLGHRMVGQFEVGSYPAAGTWFLVIFAVLLLAAVHLTARTLRESHTGKQA